MSQSESAILIVDSNILFAKNDVEIISSAFGNELSECRRYQSIELLLPEIVRAELVFRKVEYASQLTADAEKKLRTLARLTSSPEQLVDGLGR
jgi:predicted nucleic acid-binding protein